MVLRKDFSWTYERSYTDSSGVFPSGQISMQKLAVSFAGKVLCVKIVEYRRAGEANKALEIQIAKITFHADRLDILGSNGRITAIHLDFWKIQIQKYIRRDAKS